PGFAVLVPWLAWPAQAVSPRPHGFSHRKIPLHASSCRRSDLHGGRSHGSDPLPGRVSPGTHRPWVGRYRPCGAVTNTEGSHGTTTSPWVDRDPVHDGSAGGCLRRRGA